VVARDNAADGVRIEGGSAFTLIRNLTATNHPGSSDGLAVIGGGGGVIENLVASGNRFGLYLNDVGVAINGAILVIASLWLVVDFQQVENAVATRVGKEYEWYFAYGLMVTLVWVYMEALKLAFRAAMAANDRK